jgi:type II secretory pathway component PulK
MYFFSIVNNKRGSALVVALLMLVVLTLIGISATTTTTFELQIAGNDKLFKKAFYCCRLQETTNCSRKLSTVLTAPPKWVVN